MELSAKEELAHVPMVAGIVAVKTKGSEALEYASMHGNPVLPDCTDTCMGNMAT